MSDKAEEKLPVGNSEKVSTPLIQLQSKEHEEILNVIDQLRSEDLSRYISLPQLIVCGDQSSGKSSVLEAISGLEFPTKENLCTRFATELILRRADEVGVTASIHPDEDCTPVEQERIRNFRSSTVDLAQFATIVKEAENHIGVGRKGHIFSKDILRVEVSGPTQTHLTLVDLPGLYHAEDESQSAEGVTFVESLVLKYLREKRSVILAVISAQSQFALQKVTSFTRKVDPEGRRTMGIITKPDTLPPTSETERSFLNLALNKNTAVSFRLGWHVLKNREHKERHYSLDQRRDSEIRFFEGGAWTTLPRSQVGIETLRPRLSKLLQDHILSQLPSLILDTSETLKEAQAGMQRLGDARDTVNDQRRYLLHSSEHFSTLVSNGIDGVYFNAYFTDAMEDEGYEKRLRAVVQNRLSDFSDVLEDKGMQRRIVDDDVGIDDEDDEIHYSEYVEEVRQRMRRSRGKELPGTFNPLIIGDLFYLQSRPWESIVTECIDTLLEDVQKAIVPVVRAVLDEKSSSGLLEHIINPSIERIEALLRKKTEELLKPQKSGHPITYNQLFIEIVQKTREEHRRKFIRDKLKAFFGRNYGSTIYQEINMESLIVALGTETEESMEHFACSEAIFCMQAYYTVARKKFVDDFSMLAVEKCLLEPLSVIFTSRIVHDLADDIVQAIAAENESSRLERGRLTTKVEILQSGLQKLHRLDRHKASATTVFDEETSEDDLGTANGIIKESNADSPPRTASTTSSDHPRALMDEDPAAEDDLPAVAEEAVPVAEPVVDEWGSGSPATKKKKKHKKASVFE